MARQNNSKKGKANSELGLLQRRGGKDLGTRLAATPFQFMRRFAEEMEQLFDDVNLKKDWLSNALAGDLSAGMWSPQTEMVERDGRLIVRAELPGLTKDDVEVEISDDAITIEGERRGERDEKREGYYRSERSYGKFYRRLPLPQGIDAKDASATFSNGVLEIDLPAPRRVEEKGRRLEIRDESRPLAKRKAA
jgi:HSP20 family protein